MNAFKTCGTSTPRERRIRVATKIRTFFTFVVAINLECAKERGPFWGNRLLELSEIPFSSTEKVQKNPRAHKIKNRHCPPPQTTTLPPLKRGILWTWVFSCRKNAFFQAPIKLAQPFPAPELRTNNFYGHEDFFSEKCPLCDSEGIWRSPRGPAAVCDPNRPVSICSV